MNFQILRKGQTNFIFTIHQLRHSQSIPHTFSTYGNLVCKEGKQHYS